MKYKKRLLGAMCASAVAAALMFSPLAHAFKYDNPLDPNYYAERIIEVKGKDDGKISTSEFMAYHEKMWGKMVGHRDMPVADHQNPLSPHYGKEPINEMDTDHNGIITADEYMKYHEKHWEEWKAKGLVDSKGYLDTKNPLLPSYKRN